jgi:hypothetical protein
VAGADAVGVGQQASRSAGNSAGAPLFTLKVRARGSGGAARGRTRFATPFTAACWIR